MRLAPLKGPVCGAGSCGDAGTPTSHQYQFGTDVPLILFFVYTVIMLCICLGGLIDPARSSSRKKKKKKEKYRGVLHTK